MANEKVLARSVHLLNGLDLLGSTSSLNAKRGNELEVTPLGVKATSGKNQRTVLIPWANIKGVDVTTDSTQVRVDTMKRLRKPG